MIYATHRGTAKVKGMQLSNVLLILSFLKTLINIWDTVELILLHPI